MAVILAGVVAYGTREGAWMDKLAGRDRDPGGVISGVAETDGVAGAGASVEESRPSDSVDTFDPRAPFLVPGQAEAAGVAAPSAPSGTPGSDTTPADEADDGEHGGAEHDDAEHTVTEGTTDRGLRRFGVDGAPRAAPGAVTIPVVSWDAGTPADSSEEMAGFRVRLELHPTDGEALSGLVEALVAEDRVDEGLEQVARFASAGGDRERARAWIERLDPFRDARRASVDDAVTRLIARAEWCEERKLRLNQAAFLDAAAALDASLVRAGDGAAEILAVLRDKLLSDRDALASLARAGMPLGADFDRHPDKDDAQLKRIDERLRERGEANEVTTRHFVVSTEGGELLAWRAADLLEQVHGELQHRFDLPRFGRRGKHAVVVHVTEAAYNTARLQQETPPAEWTLGFLTDDGDLVALDPRVRGGSVEQLWGVLARETARRFVRELTAPTRPPLWIELGLAATVEGATRLADGSVDLSRDPPRRRRDVGLSLAGQGERPYAVDQVVRFRPEDPGATTWAWALVRYLRDAEDETGRTLFRDRWEALVDRYRTDPPSIEGLDRDEIAEGDFRLVRRLVVTDDDPRGEIDSALALQRAFHGWWRDETALDRHEAGAVGAALERSRTLTQARRHDEAAAVLRRALAAGAGDVEAWRLLVDVEDARRDDDRALLAARQVVALTDPREPSRWLPVDAIKSNLATDLAEDDATLRTAVISLVDGYVQAGLPRAARRVLDTLLAAWPLDVGYRAQRATLTEQLSGGELWQRDRLGLVEDISPFHGDATLFQANGTSLDVRCADRVRPATLRGLAHLRPPCRLRMHIAFRDSSARTGKDRRTHYVGFTFGAELPEEPGEWGLFVTPAGRIELATQGNLEWPSYAIGQGPPEALELEIRLDERSFEVLTSGKSLGVQPLDTRRAEGWLGLYARHTDARLTELIVERPEIPDPARAWWASGR